MSANNYDWAQALSTSPGSQLAAMQARQYASETTKRLMDKFDEAVMSMTAGITDPVELQAARMRAEALLAEKQALARDHATMTAPEVRAAVVQLVVKAGIRPDQSPVRFSRGLMARRAILTAIMLTLTLVQSVTQAANAQVIRHPGNKPGTISGSILSNRCLMAHTSKIPATRSTR